MAISLLESRPLPEAVRRISRKTPVGAMISSDEWLGMPLALRERAFWTANFVHMASVETMHEKLGKRINMLSETVARGERLVSRSTFIGDMKRELADAGILPPEGKEGTLQDITSRGRLGLIFDMNEQSVLEHARWKAGQDEGALDAFPAQELYREEDREIPRDWIKRWLDAGGELIDGRMIALKSDRIWMRISRFGTPWPPFDYQSGMGLRDISREDAIAFGLIKKGDKPERMDVKLNDNLQASVAQLRPELRDELKDIFGDQVNVEGEVVRWDNQKHDTSFLWDVSADGNGRPDQAAANTQAMKRTNMIIAKVHDAPEAPILPMIDGAVTPAADGEYWRASSGVLNHIGVNNPSTATGAFVQTHEVGHYVDEWMLGGGKGYASEEAKSPDVLDLLDTISQSAGYAAALDLDKQDMTSGVRAEMYWTKPSELFARAYAQWITVKSGDVGMRKELALRQAVNGAAWNDEDFKPVANAMDQLFAGRDLLR